jgi:hypothetical protein
MTEIAAITDKSSLGSQECEDMDVVPSKFCACSANQNSPAFVDIGSGGY